MSGWGSAFDAIFFLEQMAPARLRRAGASKINRLYCFAAVEIIDRT